MDTPFVRLKSGKEQLLLRKHPWLFSGAIEHVFGEPVNGSCVAVVSHRNEFLAWGAFSQSSKIQVRIWSWDEAQQINSSLIHSLLKQACDYRRGLIDLNQTTAYRVIYGESDGIPGLIVDRYGGYLVLQSLSSGVEFWLKDIVAALSEITGCKNIYERSDVDMRLLEGLPLRKGILRGVEPHDYLEIQEGCGKFLVDIRSGQKTGFYLDQRENRSILNKYAENRDVLDCFCYSGGFTVNALLGDAKAVTAIDSSSKALELCQKNVQLNGLASAKVEYTEGDVAYVLRSYRDQRRTFDLIILDPPKYAQSASQVEKASRGYKDINLLALKLLRPGGLLFSFSCSGNISPDLFQKILAGAALDAGGNVKIIKQFHQASDHPVSLNFPEGQYLKGLMLSKVG